MSAGPRYAAPVDEYVPTYASTGKVSISGRQDHRPDHRQRTDIAGVDPVRGHDSQLKPLSGRTARHSSALHRP